MKGYVVLENGDVFEGVLHGTNADVHGEIIFYTGMTGYQEVLTDPSVKGKIVVFSYPLIGNCGINESGFESTTLHASGLIVSEVSKEGFHYESGASLLAYSEDQSVPVISGIDTRAIVKRIREHGDMQAIFTTDPEKVNFNQSGQTDREGVVTQVSKSTMETFGSGTHHVVMVDFGYRKSILTSLLHEGFKVTVVPYNTSLEEIEQLRPNGVLYSNGPGNPMELQEQLSTIKNVAVTYPTLGIGLGHQLLALAFGATTEKLKTGHRGSSQPVIDQQSNRVYMTAQNHSYTVVEKSLTGTGFESKFININDQTIEGLTHTKYPIITTQFHPIAHPGPSDSEPLFLMFIEMFMSKGREKAYA